MILRCFRWGIFLCVALGSALKAQVVVDERGYQNILISFAPNVPSKEGKESIKEIRNLLESTSSALRKAIGIPIASATFLLPPSWPTNDIAVTPATIEQTTRRPDIRVDGTEDSPFGKQPFTLQHGGCGVTGHQIIIPLNFTIEESKYHKGKLLSREWLKYRYGVFDENGFQGDPMYPAYYTVTGSSEMRFTECYDSKGSQSPNPDAICRVNAGKFGYCDKEYAVNITSSLMYFHEELQNMEYICGKDDHRHNSLARNKQNSLCNDQSIWNVVMVSDDFRRPIKESSNPIQFSYVQENKPRIVVLLENSDNLLEKNIPSAIRFALRRLYYDLPPKSKMAIYTFSSDVDGTLPYAELPAQEKRTDLGIIADFGSPATGVQTSMGLSKATQILLLNSEIEKSSILLITASPLDKVPELPANLKESGICLNVLRFTDESHPVDQSYDGLATSFRCFSQESLQKSVDVVDAFHALSRFLRHPVAEFNKDFELQTVASGNMSAQSPVKISSNPWSSLFTLWLDKSLGTSSVVCKAGDAVIDLKPDTKATGIASFTFENTNDNVTCNLLSIKQSPILTEVQMRTQKGRNFDFDIWIHDFSTQKQQLPIIIYAKIYYNGYPVIQARVTTVVTFGKKREIVTMLDNGKGDPDVTEFDGIYSGYFMGFMEKGDYHISVKVDDNEGKAKIGKALKSSVPDICCGSTIRNKPYSVPGFSMEKLSMYTAKNKGPEDGYPPKRIINLRAMRVMGNILLSWATPAGGRDLKYVVKLFENREDAIARFDTTGQVFRTAKSGYKDPGDPQVYSIHLEDLKQGVTYFAAVRSQNKFNKLSAISNVVEFIPVREGGETSSTLATTTDGRFTNPDPNKDRNKTLGIVLGVLGGIVVLCILGYLGYYFFVKKNRQDQSNSRDETRVEQRR